MLNTNEENLKDAILTFVKMVLMSAAVVIAITIALSLLAPSPRAQTADQPDPKPSSISTGTSLIYYVRSDAEEEWEWKASINYPMVDNVAMQTQYVIKYADAVKFRPYDIREAVSWAADFVRDTKAVKSRQVMHLYDVASMSGTDINAILTTMNKRKLGEKIPRVAFATVLTEAYGVGMTEEHEMPSTEGVIAVGTPVKWNRYLADALRATRRIDEVGMDEKRSFQEIVFGVMSASGAYDKVGYQHAFEKSGLIQKSHKSAGFLIPQGSGSFQGLEMYLATSEPIEEIAVKPVSAVTFKGAWPGD